MAAEPLTGTKAPGQAVAPAAPKQPDAATSSPRSRVGQRGASGRRSVAELPHLNGAPSINPVANARSSSTSVNNDPTPDQVRKKLNESFTESQLNLMWDAYIGVNPTAHILVNTMRTSRPKLVEPTRFIVAVENDKQVETMKAAASSLRSYLRSRLKNDFLTFEVVVNEEESSPRTWNAREVYQYMLENSEGVKLFVEEFKMNLV